MYAMCVCLLSALSRRVGALQTSIIVIIIIDVQPLSGGVGLCCCTCHSYVFRALHSLVC